MKPLIAVLFAVVGAVVVLGAQTPTRGNVPVVAPTPDPPAQTVAGCLRQTDPGKFVLAEAAEVKAGQTDASGSKRSYTVVGMIPPTVKLSQHVNHKVEISGTIAEGTKLDVRALKMVSATCP